MEKYNFYSALNQLNDFYGIDIHGDDFENIALHAWDHIGNKDFKLYSYTATIEDHKIELPCNTDIIEGVFKLYSDVTRTDGISYDGVTNMNSTIESDIESHTPKTSQFYNSGEFVNYERHFNTLTFKENNINVVILYKGVLSDEDGLPYLNFKEVDAIAKYCAFIDLQKKAMITKDQNTFQMAQLMRQQWQFSVEDARSPIYLNQNDIDKILDVQSSWDRKRFGLSFKMLR